MFLFSLITMDTKSIMSSVNYLNCLLSSESKNTFVQSVVLAALFLSSGMLPSHCTHSPAEIFMGVGEAEVVPGGDRNELPAEMIW